MLMSWTQVALEKPQRYLIVLGAILEGYDRRAVRMVTWDGLAWCYHRARPSSRPSHFGNTPKRRRAGRTGWTNGRPPHGGKYAFTQWSTRSAWAHWPNA